MNKIALVAALGAVVTTTGCATKEYVHEYVDGQLKPVKAHVQSVDERDARTAQSVKNLSMTVEEAKAALASNAAATGRNSANIAQLSKTTQEAVDRATAAGKLAAGKLVYEVVLTDDTLRFKSDRTTLSTEAMAALDDFAAKLKSDNKNVYIEIQGHTDSRGGVGANLRLGEARAEAVLRYLNMKGGIPLHRLAAISYGESAPVADNMNMAGRSQNRRVVLVVFE
jgi:outer membrane protein OmpA-like peptidoglycan-associated protein